jgi:hypothetical protein
MGGIGFALSVLARVGGETLPMLVLGELQLRGVDRLAAKESYVLGEEMAMLRAVFPGQRSGNARRSGGRPPPRR